MKLNVFILLGDEPELMGYIEKIGKSLWKKYKKEINYSIEDCNKLYKDIGIDMHFYTRLSIWKWAKIRLSNLWFNTSTIKKIFGVIAAAIVSGLIGKVIDKIIDPQINKIIDSIAMMLLAYISFFALSKQSKSSFIQPPIPLFCFVL